DIPTFPWKSAMSLPRSLGLKKINNEWTLIQQPVTALKKLRANTVEIKNITVAGKKELPVKTQQLEMEVVMQPEQNVISGVHLAVGKQNVFIIGYDASSKKLFIDRSGCSNNAF